MSYFAVLREAGPRWDPGKPMREQAGWVEHAAFMNALAAEGFIVFGGPLAGSEAGRVRALLVVSAAGEAEIRRRLEADPWAPMGILVIARVDPWDVLLGRERIEAARKTG